MRMKTVVQHIIYCVGYIPVMVCYIDRQQTCNSDRITFSALCAVVYD